MATTPNVTIAGGGCRSVEYVPIGIGHCRPVEYVPIGIATAVSSADVERIARRVVTLLREEWSKSDVCACGFIPEPGQDHRNCKGR